MSEVVHNIQIGIDGTSAPSGARVVKRSLDDINSSVDNVNSNMKKMESAFGMSGSASSQAAQQMGASWSQAANQMQSSSNAASAAMNKTSQSAKEATSQMKLLGVSVQDLEAMFGRLLVRTIAIAAIYGTISLVKRGFQEAVKAVEDFQVATIQIAAALTQIAAINGSKDIVKSYKESAIYAQVLVQKLQEIDPLTFANFKGLMNMTQVMTAQGVVLDVNNKKQVQAFTDLSNAIALYTAGQNQEMQSFKEMRALMSGVVDKNAQLSKNLDLQIKQQGIYKGGLKEVVELGKQHGDLLERLQPYLKGINAASKDIEGSWTAIKSSFQTALNLVQRAGFKDIVADMSVGLNQVNVYLKEHAEEIGTNIKNAWIEVKYEIKNVWEVLQLGWPIIKTTGVLIGDLVKTVRTVTDAVKSIPEAFKEAPTIVAYTLGTIGVVAYSAVGGIAALSLAYGGFMAAVTASMAANPIGWIAAGLVALYVAGRPVIALFDDLLQKWSGLTEAQNKAAEADQRELNLKQKLIWMYREGGIALTENQKKYAGIVDAPKGGKFLPETETNAKSAKDLLQQQREVRDKAYALQVENDKIEMNRIKNQSNLELDQLNFNHKLFLVSDSKFLEDKAELQRAAFEKEREQLNNHYKLAQKNEADAKAMLGHAPTVYDKKTKAIDKDATEAANLKLQADYTKQVEIAKKAGEEITALEAKRALEVQNNGQASVELIKKQADTQTNAASQLLNDLGETSVATKMQIDLENRNRQVQDAATESYIKKSQALRQLKADQEQYNALQSIKNKTEDIKISLVSDPYEKQRLMIEANFNREKELIEQKIKLLETAGASEINTANMVHSVEVANEIALQKIKFFDNKAKLDALNAAVIAAESERTATVSAVQIAGQQKTNEMIGALKDQISALIMKKDKDLKDNQVAQSKAGWDSVINFAKQAVPKLAKFDALIAASQKDHTIRGVDGVKDQTKSNLSMYADYANAVGGMFAGMAAQQDQSSRAGFETAKAYNLAAAVMSTAAGIMNQYTTGDPYTANFRAAIVAAIGAMQIGIIASTTYGGGAATPNVSAGSFSGGSAGQGGSVGGSIGAPITSIKDSQTQDTLQRIAGSMENASLAIGKVADGLIKVSSLFSEGGFLKLVGGALALPGLTQQGSGLFSGMKTIIADSIKNSLFGGIPIFGTTDLKSALINSILPGLGGIASSIFGGGQSIEGQGVMLGIAGGKGTAQNYADIKTDGGWFGNDSHSTRLNNNQQMTDVVNAVITSISATINRSAVAMGTTSNLSMVNLSGSKIATAGRTADDINKDLQKWFETASNELAKTVVGLKDFAFYGEDAFTALVRLSTALQSTNEGLELIGARLLPATLSSANVAFKLQDMMGGAEKFATAIDNYFTSMFTDQQQEAAKAAQAQRQVTVGFAEINAVMTANGGLAYTLPTTKSQFIALVDSLNLSSDSGARTFAALMDLSKAFGVTMDYADKLKSSFEDLVSRSLTYTVESLQVAMDLSAKTLKSAISVAMSATDALISLRTGSLSTASPTSQYNDLKAAFIAAASANNSSLILSQWSAFLTASKSYNASGGAYQTDYQLVADALSKIIDIGPSNPTLTELQTHRVLLISMDNSLTNQTGVMETNNSRLSDLNSLMAAYLGNHAVAKDAAQAAYDSKVSSISGVMGTLSSAQTVNSLGSALTTMSGYAANTSVNPFDSGVAANLATLASQIVAGTAPPGSAQVLQDNINAGLSNYLKSVKDTLANFGVTVTLPTITGLDSLPLVNTPTDIAMQKKAQAEYPNVLQMAVGSIPKDMAYDVAPINPTTGRAAPDGILNAIDALVWGQLSTGILRWSDLGLPAFATGGITSQPSIFGEAGPEAAVPLPDGRSIPVTLSRTSDNYKELVEEVKALRAEVRAGVRVAQAVGTETIAIGKQQVRAGESLANTARLA